MQQAHFKHRKTHLKQSAEHIKTDCTGNKISNTLHHMLESMAVHHVPFTCKRIMPKELESYLAFAYWALLATMRE